MFYWQVKYRWWQSYINSLSTLDMFCRYAGASCNCSNSISPPLIFLLVKLITSSIAQIVLPHNWSSLVPPDSLQSEQCTGDTRLSRQNETNFSLQDKLFTPCLSDCICWNNNNTLWKNIFLFEGKKYLLKYWWKYIIYLLFKWQVTFPLISRYRVHNLLWAQRNLYLTLC